MLGPRLLIFISDLQLTTFTEILSVSACIVAGLFIGKFLVKLVKKSTEKTIFLYFLRATIDLIIPAAIFVALLLALIALYYSSLQPVLTIFFIKMAVAWLAIGLVKLLTTRRATGWFVAIVIIPITVLNLFGLWEPCANYLESLTFFISKVQFSVYQILRTLFIVIVLFRLTRFITLIGEDWLRRLHSIKSSDKVLILKIIQIIIYFVILLIALNLLGMNITALAVFSGAIGVGLGFGLQKITSNFISGVIILLEKSIEVDDLVELSDGTTGVVKRTGGRYILIETLQGKEVLVPNEDFITQRVISWTYTNHRCRIEIPISVAYSTDLELAKRVMLEAARSCANVAKDLEPECYLREFGLNSINFWLFFWINDVTNGRYEPQSNVMFAVWKKFKEHGIEMPCSQMDVYLKSMPDKK